MRAIIIAVFIAILPSVVLAQSAQTPANPERPLTTNGMASVPQAPIGHRQPTERDLPPSVRHEENAALPGRLEPPGVPKICQGC
jgi:hypothetical protein